jgi:uncharacterized protein (DUF983 family)
LEHWSTINTIQALNLSLFLLIFIGYPALIISALFSLRKRKLTGIVSAIWVLIILFVPFLGALSLWIVNPQKDFDKNEIT